MRKGASDRPEVRAAVMRGPGRIGVEAFPYPRPEPGAVVMRVEYSGICGTDKHTYRGETKQYAGTPHEIDIEFPLICGHENVGTVEETGGMVLDSEGVALRPGDRIVPAANVACGECFYCRNGFVYYACEHLKDYGNSLNAARPPHLFGGWAEYLYLLPGTPIFRVPPELPSEIAVLAEEMSVTHGLDAARLLAAVTGGPTVGESIVVYGVGPLGLCHVVKARLIGAGAIVAIDRLSHRLEVAATFGADTLLDVTQTDEAERLERVRAATGGRGADVVVDCSGQATTLSECLRMVRFGGTVVEAGAFVDMGPTAVNPSADFCARNVALLGIGGERSDLYLPTMKMLAANVSRLPLASVVSHRMPLERAAEAIELAQSNESMKVVMVPGMAAPGG
jgi:threonine dehydrogenase-like Zn-dependent dehydrogenase